MARRARGQAQTIAITSGKGGVGKTNLAVNLAAVLATLDRRVVLLDADLGLANADILCGIQPRYNLAHVVTGQRRLEEVLTPVPVRGAPRGFSLIPGASGLARMADLSEAERRRIVTELQTLQDSSDVIIVDTGAGIGRNVLAFAAAAENVMVVTTPEPTAITDAYAVIKVLARCQSTGKISVVANQVKGRDEGRIVHERLSGVARQFLQTDVAFGGYVVHDLAVPQSVRRRTTFVTEYPNSLASKCILAWANRIDHHVDVSSGHLRHGFFHRLASWWR
jgi:flagellar biosynthesis protein FlhG